MRIHYSESFPAEATESGEAETTFRLIRRIMDDRMAAEIIKRLRSKHQSDSA